MKKIWGVKDHDPGCPRLQFWDAGEFEAPCTCGEGLMDNKTKDSIFEIKIRHSLSKVTEASECSRCKGTGVYDIPTWGGHTHGVTCPQCGGCGYFISAAVVARALEECLATFGWLPLTPEIEALNGEERLEFTRNQARNRFFTVLGGNKERT